MGINQRVITSPLLFGVDQTDAARVVWPYAEKGKLEAVYLENGVLISADNTNNVTISGTMNSTTIFSRQTNVAGGALAQGVESQSLGASMVGEKLEVSAGDTISLDVAKAGTGPNYRVQVSLVFNLIN